MKRILKIFAIGIVLGLALVALQRFFGLDEDVFMRGYWIAAPAIILAAALINILYNASYLRRLRRAVPLLEEDKPQEYIAAVKALLQTAKGRRMRSILTLNLAAGYVSAKEFDTAIPMLEGMDDKELWNSAARVVHRINLSMSCFETGQYQRAADLYRENEALLARYRENKIYGANIAILDAIAALVNRRYEEGEAILDRAVQTWPDPRFQRVFEEIRLTLGEMRDQEPAADGEETSGC